MEVVSGRYNNRFARNLASQYLIGGEKGQFGQELFKWVKIE